MNPRTPQSAPGTIVRINAATVIDAHRAAFAPGSLLLDTGPASAPAVTVRGRPLHPAPLRVLAVGRPADLDAHPAARATDRRVLDLPRAVVIPGLVNAHTHLDLTHIGPQPHDPEHGFVPWIDMVRAGRRTDPDAIADSVRTGAALCLHAGVVAVGDIAGATAQGPQTAPMTALAETPLTGVSFAEFFAMGNRENASRARAEVFLNTAPVTLGRVRRGVSPHAPNTVARPSYDWAVEQAARRGMAVMTHLAETAEERRFISQGDGPQRDLLERLGVWDDSIAPYIGAGRSPVGHLEPVLARAREVLPARGMAVVHVNDASDADIEVLARTGAIVCYCPRASAYFGAPVVFGAHRLRDMLAAGVRAALGTDSLINLPRGSDAPDGAGLGPWEEMRLLCARDGFDARTLLGLATLGGAAALAMDPACFVFNAGGSLAGVVSVALPEGEPAVGEATALLAAALRGSEHPELLLIGNGSCLTGIG